MKTTSKRIEWIDYAKGISIILVVYAHITNGYLISYSEASSMPWIKSTMRFAYTASLHSFFFLAGLVAVKLQKRSFADVLVNKIRSILIPYILWSLILGSLKSVFSRNTIVQISWNDLLYIFVEPIGITWFLYVLFWFYIIYKILSLRLSAPLILIISVVLLILGYFSELILVRRFTHYFIYFVIGTTLSKWILNDYYLKYFKCWVAFPVSIILYISAYSVMNVHVAKYLIELSTVYLVISIALNAEKYGHVKLIKYFGLESLTIYLVHMLPLTAFRVVLLNYLHVFNEYFYVILQVILTISFSVFFIKITEKLNIRKLLFGR